MNKHQNALKKIVDEQIRKDFRIVTNGIKFKIQYYEPYTGLLSWLNKYFDGWITVRQRDREGNLGYTPYPDLNTIKDDMEELMFKIASQMYGWHEV